MSAALPFIPRLDARDLLARAERRTGESASEALRAPLGILLDAVRREADLTAIGRFWAATELTRLAENALAIDRAHAQDPSLAGRPVAAPLFITGLPRSGTSFLHGLLACDPASRAPLAWETIYAVPTQPARRRIARTRLFFAAAYCAAPAFRPIQPIAAMLPHECITIMAHRFLSYQFQFAFRVPSYHRWLALQDLRPVYLYHRRFLQLLGKVPPLRWILKAPSHLFALPALLAAYPDARILFLHRDPVISIASMASFTHTLRRAVSRSADAEEIGSEQAGLWAHGLAAASRFRHDNEALADRFFDLRFADLVRDPMAAVARLYDWSGWRLSPEAVTAMHIFLAARRQLQTRRHHYVPEHFGLRRERERQRFGAYIEQFGVATEC